MNKFLVMIKYIELKNNNLPGNPTQKLYEKASTISIKNNTAARPSSHKKSFKMSKVNYKKKYE